MRVRMLILSILIVIIAACGPGAEPPKSSDASDSAAVPLPTSQLATDEDGSGADRLAEEIEDVLDVLAEEADEVASDVTDANGEVTPDGDAEMEEDMAVASEDGNEAVSAEFPANRPDFTADLSTQTTYNDVLVGFTEGGNAYIGDLSNAPVIIEEYSDFQCPYCARFFDQTLDSLLTSEIANGQAALIFFDFPLNFHAQAAQASNAARCAGEQGADAYWGMHDELFDNLGQWGVADPTLQFTGYAENLGIDTESFGDCYAEGRYDAAVQADLSAGQQRGIRGTPGFIINGELISGAQPYQVFNQAIGRAASGEAVAQQPAQVPVEDIEVETPEPFPLSDNFAAALGDPNAPVVVVEFTDYQCPFCGRHSSQTLPALISDYVDEGRIYYIMKDLPLDQIHPAARDAAAAARCAGQQDAYWEMHDLLFATQDQWGGSSDMQASFTGFITQLGLDEAAFATCYADQSVREAIEANVQEAQEIGIGGTPFFFIDGFPVINGAQPIDVFNQVIGLAEEGELVNAIMDAQRRQLAAQQQQAQAEQPQAPAQPSGPVDVPLGDAFAIGDPDAPITIVEYTDYQCPFCSRHHSQTFSQLKSEYVDKGLVYYVFKDFPLNFHPQAEGAAVAARCAGRQGQFLEMHNRLFEGQGEWNGRTDAPTVFATYASELSLDADAFAACQNDSSVAEEVRADLAEGSSLGVRGTPAFFINGSLVSGAQPFNVFQQTIDSELNNQ